MDLRTRAALWAPWPHWPLIVACGIGPAAVVAVVSRGLMVPVGIVAVMLQIVIFGRIQAQALPEKASGFGAILKEYSLSYLTTIFLVAVVGLVLTIAISRLIYSPLPKILVNGPVKGVLAIFTIYVWPLVFLRRSSVAAILAGVLFLVRNFASSMWILGVVATGQVINLGGQVLYIEYKSGWSFGLLLVTSVTFVYLGAVSFAAALHTLLGAEIVESPVEA